MNKLADLYKNRHKLRMTKKQQEFADTVFRTVFPVIRKHQQEINKRVNKLLKISKKKRG